ncbi:hypothetical protein BRARA_D02862 [Brassica rapa]|uniref:Pectinesterase inhibitor domain-containing protein n=2 Tax=Brassica TaxID=3705 RepID=A0A397ZY94_BRACM|nr:pectinesterase inhibitor 6 [Brassica rapa]XP_013688591.3 pectinesterase inhibitor 6-like [Brassica napus]KAH0908075.1 hypothetical protein HID58_031396 [Brassica napus]RID67793.1 hypothetical protein BRARA_D02862 [Brassica rapa]CAF2304849.1 unnamed protein product [Brassica napus]
MNSFITFALLSLLLALNSNPSYASGRNHTDDTNACRVTRYSRYIKNACSVTQNQQLCFRTLWPFAIVAKNNSSKWARASVAVTITDTKQILRLLLKTRSSAVGKRERVALSDCRELFVDSLGNLYKSLALLRKLDADEFQQQMSDLATWLSSALTDEDTCLDGFEETSIRSSTVRMIRRRATRCMQLCSNALAILSKLAYDGL